MKSANGEAVSLEYQIRYMTTVDPTMKDHPEEFITSITDYATRFADPARSAPKEVKANEAKALFGPDNQNLIAHLPKEAQQRVYAAFTSPQMKDAMRKFAGEGG